jgi:hypothetical protein
VHGKRAGLKVRVSLSFRGDQIGGTQRRNKLNNPANPLTRAHIQEITYAVNVRCSTNFIPTARRTALFMPAAVMRFSYHIIKTQTVGDFN